jgi:hypothetical protein
VLEQQRQLVLPKELLLHLRQLVQTVQQLGERQLVCLDHQ